MANRLIYQLQIDGLEHTETLILPAGVTRIGRTPGNDLELPHQFVSSRHAQIVCDETGCLFTDLGSTNGTLVNGEKLPPPDACAHGRRDGHPDWSLPPDGGRGG